ncbi:hypothetical protein CALVIDRAFT_567174 [Calocera viscosa TUFC12733]|uniref:Uncharacterized protein n=1 Tax=Calocera viscosa (strain TUFC12733) TaxID=1330018 RepID=A0A167IIT7_CALVF|nr:hypothetical protein CALVIDRAFT_567174 [Calocera viscosa TUFC12733]
MDLKGKGKAGYQRVPGDQEPPSQGLDIELDSLQGGTSRFPIRYLKDNVRLDDEAQGAPGEQGVLYHEKQWPSNRRVWKRRWCEWRIILLLVLGTMVFGTIVFAIKGRPKQPNIPLVIHPVSFGSDLGCIAPYFYIHEHEEQGYSLYNSTSMSIPLAGTDFTLTIMGYIATGTVTLIWDRDLPASSASVEMSISSQNPGFFDFTAQFQEATRGFFLNVYDEANDMTNCVVYNLTLRLPSEVSTLSLNLQSRGQVRFLPPSHPMLDDGTGAATEPHTLEQLSATFSSNRTGSMLILSEAFRTEKASITMSLGEITGSWRMPRQLELSLGPEVDVGAGLEFFPFDG